MLRALVILLFVVIFGSPCLVLGQGKRMRETPAKSIRASPAPAKCLAVLREFIAYLNTRGNDLITDNKAQLRFLSKGMRLALIDKAKHLGDPRENPDSLRNDTYVGVWSWPTTYSVVGSRNYDYRDKENVDDYRTIVDVIYEWDKKDVSLDNQYPGNKSLFSFIFVFEDGSWKLDDRYTFSDEYSRPESLRSYLESRSD
jgi:hypothetical protein